MCVDTMIPLWSRCVIAGCISFIVRWVFIWVPTHTGLKRQAVKHWIPIIITFPFNTLLTSIMVLLNMDAVSGSDDYQNLLRAFYTLVWMCPANVLATWLTCTVASKVNAGKVAAWACGMVASVSVWIAMSLLVYYGVLASTQEVSRYGYNYAGAAVLGSAGWIGSILMNKLETVGAINHSDDGRPKWVAGVLSTANAGLVILMTILSDTANRSSLTVTGLLMSVPFGMYVCFGYIWFPDVEGQMTNAQRANRCRSILWPTCYGFRASDFYCALLPIVVHALAWKLWWLAVCISFVVAVCIISGTQAALIQCTNRSKPVSEDVSRLVDSARAAVYYKRLHCNTPIRF